MPSSRLLIFLFAFLCLLPSPRVRQNSTASSPSTIRSVDDQATSVAAPAALPESCSVTRFARFRSRVRYICTEGETPEFSETEIGLTPPPTESGHSLTGLVPLSHVPAHSPFRC